MVHDTVKVPGVDYSISIFGRVMVHDWWMRMGVDLNTTMLSYMIIDTPCFNMNREERLHHRRELYRLRREKKTPFSFCARGPCFNSTKCTLDTKWMIS